MGEIIPFRKKDSSSAGPSTEPQKEKKREPDGLILTILLILLAAFCFWKLNHFEPDLHAVIYEDRTVYPINIGFQPEVLWGAAGAVLTSLAALRATRYRFAPGAAVLSPGLLAIFCLREISGRSRIQLETGFGISMTGLWQNGMQMMTGAALFFLLLVMFLWRKETRTEEKQVMKRGCQGFTAAVLLIVIADLGLQAFSNPWYLLTALGSGLVAFALCMMAVKYRRP